MTEEQTQQELQDQEPEIDLHKETEWLREELEGQRSKLDEAIVGVRGLSKRLGVLGQAMVTEKQTEFEFLIEGIIVANQGSSEWCLRYLQRAVTRDYITRDFAQTLLFNVIRVDGYWRTRFEQMMPEEG